MECEKTFQLEAKITQQPSTGEKERKKTQTYD